MAGQQVRALDTGHTEMIHDAQMDYYGRRLATASSDRTVKVFDVAGEQHQLLAELRGHEGPVWQVSWSHPSFGNLLASCSYDCKIMIWREDQKGVWSKIWTDASHTSSVNTVAWAPHSLGCILAAASSDGRISVHTYEEESRKWSTAVFDGHPNGVTSLSWGPGVKKGALLANQDANKALLDCRFVTGGCDNRVRLWSFNEAKRDWTEERVWETDGEQHGSWVRGVAWAPSLGLPANTIASCSEDKSVIIWTEQPNGQWKKQKTLQFDHKVWRVSWSLMGSILAVSQGDNKVSLWKESLDGEWKNLTAVGEEGEEKED